MDQDIEPSDEGAVRRRRERLMEMAAMFKEIQKGSDNIKLKLLARFSLQEGVSMKKTKEYFSAILASGLVKQTNGHKSWRYEPKEEWELFKVEI
jgi:predicted transcriptional regulator